MTGVAEKAEEKQEGGDERLSLKNKVRTVVGIVIAGVESKHIILQNLLTALNER